MKSGLKIDQSRSKIELLTSDYVEQKSSARSAVPVLPKERVTQRTSYQPKPWLVSKLVFL